jgi:hypothetical protein
MQYAASLPFRGDTDRAFGLAESALTAIGFRVTGRTTGSLEMIGPGMNSSRESALVGASRIHVQSGPGELELGADLGGVARMSRFVTLFPIGLVLVLGVVLSVVFGVLQGPGIWVAVVAAVVGGNVVLWLLLGPLMARWIRARTCRGLDALLANMVAVGEAAEPIYGRESQGADGQRDEES